jgi:hypothetical protein
MKKIGFVLLLTTFSFNLFCQQDTTFVRNSYYRYSWDTTKYMTKIYNS